MGINSYTNILWSAKDLTFNDLLTVYHQHKKNQSHQLCKIDVDLNWLVNKVGQQKTYPEIVNSTDIFMKTLAHTCGTIVTGVLDGDCRPDCKRDSWKRNRDIEISRIDAFYCLQSAMALAAQIDETGTSKKNTYKISQLDAEAKSLEKHSSKNFVLHSFKTDLEERIFFLNAHIKHSNNGGYVNPCVIKSKYQADSFLAYHNIYNLSDFILSIDSKFTMYLGPLGVFIRDIDLKRKQGSKKNSVNTDIATITIGGCINVTMEKINSVLTGRNNITWKKASYPVLDSNDIILRTYISLTLGCD